MAEPKVTTAEPTARGMSAGDRRDLRRLLHLSGLSRRAWLANEGRYLYEWQDLTSRSRLGDLLVGMCEEAPVHLGEDEGADPEQA